MLFRYGGHAREDGNTEEVTYQKQQVIDCNRKRWQIYF